MKTIALVFLAFLFAAGTTLADDRIWSALVLATNEKPPRPVPEKLAAFAPTIREVFGYHSLYLVGEKRSPIGWGDEIWLVPTKEFFFQVCVMARDETHYHVQLELFRGKEPLLSTKARLARGAPLYFRGPQWGNGQLVLLVEIR